MAVRYSKLAYTKTYSILFETVKTPRDSVYEILNDRDSHPCRRIFVMTMNKTGLVVTKDFTDTADQEIGSRVDVRQRRQYQQINSHLSPLHTIRILKRAPGTKFLNLATIFIGPRSDHSLPMSVTHCTMRLPMSIDISEVFKCKNSFHAHFKYNI